MLSLVVGAFKNPIMFPCTPFANKLFGKRRLGFISPCIPHYTGFSLCRFTWSGFGIPLITVVSVTSNTFILDFTLWGWDLVSIVRIRESPYYRGFFFFVRKYIRILSGHWKLSVIVGFHMTSLKFKLKTLSILPRFYFHDALEQLKTNFHTNCRFKGFLVL